MNEEIKKKIPTNILEIFLGRCKAIFFFKNNI